MRGIGLKGIRLGNRISSSTPPSVVIDPDAQALFDAVGDVPEWFKPATNDLIISFKNEGVWTNPNFYALLCVPSKSSDSTLIEIKSLTVRAYYDINGGIPPSTKSIYRTFSTNDGYLMEDSWIDTDLQPSTEYTANDHSDWMVLYEDETAPAISDYNYGAFDNPNFMGVTAISNTNLARAYSYRTTESYQGTTNAGDAGVYINNRQSSTYAELVVNGAIVGTRTTTAGSPTVRTIYLNRLNRTAGTFRNKSRFTAWGSFGSGLDSTQRDNLSTSLQLWQDTLKRKKSLKTKSIIWDGNSFNTFWLSALQRGTQYILGDNRELHFDSVAISGKELREMDSQYATDVTPLYDGSLSKNIYIINETVNDYTNHGNLTDTKNYLTSLVTKAKADGFDVLVFGGPVREHQVAFAVPDQQTLNLGLDDYQNWLIAQSSIQGFTYVAPPSNIWIFRSDYASDADYNTACQAIYTNPLIMETQFSHPTEEVCIEDWSPLIATEINNTL